MNYIGSKTRLCKDFIPRAVNEVCGKDISGFTFCDIFAGTGAVGKVFKSRCAKIISNDIELYSYVLNRCNIRGGVSEKKAKELIERLNSTPLLHGGFIAENYSEGGTAGRLYFSKENGARIDTARTTIERWKQTREITPDEYFFLLSSLLESADKVANVPSVYAAYLKKLKPSAQQNMILAGAETDFSARHSHAVYRADANLLAEKISGDILYLDPPYNQRQYGAYYHILNTIAEYRPFSPRGITGMRSYSRSSFCSRQKAKSALETLVKKARFRYVFLSYNNEGIISPEEIRDIFEKEGRYNVFTTQYQRFKQDSGRKAKAAETTEYLHVLEKDAK